ncbi:MAG: hypothetical protein CSA33_03465 [Desulfobulbus propionicus]|nr:MAG: hypothetical protein CSA33_03465 [Desulfobulbus propionicus]
MSTRKKLLVVDDEQPVLELFREVLQKHGHQVDVAENGRNGFRKAVTHAYDCVICDLYMPEWNGVDSIKAILLVKPESTFIVVSGYFQKVVADELRGMKEVLAVLGKPINFSELLEHIAHT